MNAGCAPELDPEVDAARCLAPVLQLEGCSRPCALAAPLAALAPLAAPLADSRVCWIGAAVGVGQSAVSIWAASCSRPSTSDSSSCSVLSSATACCCPSWLISAPSNSLVPSLCDCCEAPQSRLCSGDSGREPASDSNFWARRTSASGAEEGLCGESVSNGSIESIKLNIQCACDLGLNRYRSTRLCLLNMGARLCLLRYGRYCDTFSAWALRRLQAINCWKTRCTPPTRYSTTSVHRVHLLIIRGTWTEIE